MEDFRKVFNSIPEEFDKWRPRYCDAVFEDVIRYASVTPASEVLEIGPGTGQATEPFLKTGCGYRAIELGEEFTAFLRNRFRQYENMDVINADFETHDFGKDRFDLVFSAATIQWIPEEIAFPKVFEILKSGGAFAMMMTFSDEKGPNEALYEEIQKVYDRHFHPEERYTCYLEYENTAKYGFPEMERREYPMTRVLTADEYVSWISTHAEHITLKEPHRNAFFSGIRQAIESFGGSITVNDTIILYLTRKP